MAVRTDQDEELHPITVDAYHRMFEAGVVTEDDRIELLNGALFPMSPEGEAHAAVLTRLVGALWKGVADGLVVRAQHPMTLAPASEPEPDVLVTDEAAYGWSTHPSSGHLVVEVSSSSLRIDRGRKVRIYAGAGVPEYWVVDVARGVVHVHRDPRGDAYAVTFDAHPPQALEPLHPGVPAVDLGALLRRR